MLLSVIIFRIALIALAVTILAVIAMQYRAADRLQAFGIVETGLYGIVSIMALLGVSFVLNFMGL